MDTLAPPHLAEDWDNVGLMVGNPNKMVENVLLALEVTEDVIDEAINRNADLIITHHPLIYKPIKKIVTNDPISKMLIRLVQNDINLFVSHTNLDAADEGTSQYIADLLELDRIDYITKTDYEIYYKIQTSLPKTHEDAVKRALTQSGAGAIGDYTNCTFTTEGIGQFKPTDRAEPFIGSANELSSVEEVKIETIVPESHLQQTITSLLKAHPYEEPAYDVIKLENKIGGHGIGKYGYLQNMTKLSDLADHVKRVLDIKQVKVIGNLDKKINRVAIITGGGADYYKDVIKAADVLVTGDIKYHEAQYALQLNLAVIDAGHFETENLYMNRLKEILDEAFEEKSYDIQVMVSDIDVNPFQIV